MFGLRKLQSAAFRSSKNQSRKQRNLRSLLGEQLEARRVLANYVVDTAEDVVAADGMLSLREALQAANTNAAVNADTVAGEAGPGVVDTISFAAALTEIILTSELTVSDSVTVSLGAAAEMTINGNNAHRLFSIDAGANAAVANVVTIDGLRLINGASASGGAIRVAGGQSLTLDTVTLENNLATGEGAAEGGGALFNDGGNVTIVDSTINRNAAAGVAPLSFTGEQEVPPVTTSASGSGYLSFDPETDTVDINALFTGLELQDADPDMPQITNAHIHIGATGVGGGVSVAIPLTNFSAEPGGIRLRANNITIPANDVATLISGGLYVNIHSSANTGGELRAQITFPTVMGSGGAIFNNGGTLNVTDTVISNNTASRAGGAIEATTGTLNLTRVTMRDNVAGPEGIATPGNGGAIHVSGAATVNLEKSTIGANIAALEGGGLWNSATGTLNVLESTISGNSAELGGGLFNDGAGGTINVTNSTIAANTSETLGGGIANDGGNLNLKSATIARNTAATGGGLNSTGGTITAINTILAANTAQNQTDGSGAITSNGNNLFGATDGLTLSGPQTGDVVNVNPLLETLADNGGPTRTIALMAGSPALSAGIADGLTVDQRGLARRQGPNVDIGAFESALAAVNDPPTVSVTAVAATTAEGNTGTTTVTFTVTRIGQMDIGFDVSYAVTGAATSGVSADDFEGGVFPRGTVTFAANDATQTITFNVVGDATFESDEGLIVTLSNPTGTAVIGTGTATATITNDDTATVAMLSIAATQADRDEGSTGTTPFTFTVSRSGVTTGTTTVDYAVTGSGVNPANANDFENAALATGTVTFADTETQKTITINVAGDAALEQAEEFTVTLSNASGGAMIPTATAIATIRNDDVPAVVPNFSIAATSATLAEGNTGTTTLTFTVTRSVVTTGTDSIDFNVDAVHGAFPAAPDDFVGAAFPSGTINFLDGGLTKVITIEVNGDTVVEETEEFEVTLSNATRNGLIVVDEASGTITNDDMPPPALVSIITTTSSDAFEGNTGVASLTFTITRSANFSDSISVNYAVTGSGLNPAVASDFPNGQFPTGTVTFASGQLTQTVTIPVAGDTTFEPDEGFTVTLSGLIGNATLQNATANGTIRNDDQPPPPRFAIVVADASALEGNTGLTPLTFTVTRSDNSIGTDSVGYTVTGSGTSPATENDFANNVFASGTLTFGPEELTKTITIEVNGDTNAEVDETFTVELANPTGSGTISQATAIGTIRNDDVSALPVIAIVAVDAEKSEGNTGTTPFTFTVSRAGNTQGTSTVQYAVTGTGGNPALNTDFENDAFPSGTVSFADGESIKNVTLNVEGETEFETDKSFAVTLSNPTNGATLGTTVASGLILNDDRSPLPKISILAASADKNEGNSGSTAFTFTVRRSEITTGVTSVMYSLTGTGTNPVNAADFAADNLPSGIVRFENLETTKTITIDIAGDTTLETDETFLVTLENPVEDFELVTATATGTVRNDDSPPARTLSIAATSAEKNEGNTGNTLFTFTVTRSVVTTGASTVAYAVTGIGTNPASATDFQGGQFPTGTVTFADGDTTRTITVTVVGDTIFENDEGFEVTLSGPSAGTVIQVGTAQGSIDNDDATPVPTLAIAATSADKNEGQSGTTDFTFTVTRSVNTAGPTTVDYTVTGATTNGATEGDFELGGFPSGTVSFSDGETTKTITVTVRGDISPETNESFIVTLSNPSGDAIIATASSTGVIRDDDLATEFAIAVVEADNDEGDTEFTPFTFTVTRSVNLVGASTIAYLVSPSGTNPADAQDFLFGVFPSGTLTFVSGEASKTITINVVGDRAIEPDDSFLVTLSGASGNARIVTATANGLIRNDDDASVALVSITTTNAPNDEGDEGTSQYQFTVTRSVNLGLATTVNYSVVGAGTTPASATDFFGDALPSGTISFAAGETTKTILVDVKGDSDIEVDESFNVVLSNISAGSTIVTGTASAVIRNDDMETAPATLAIAATAASKDEGNSGLVPFTFTVTRSDNPTGELTVNYAVTGAATNGASADDFASGFPSGTVTFADGVTTQTVTINVAGDVQIESDETFVVSLSNPSGAATITTGSASGLIRNDDVDTTTKATLSIAATDATRVEGNAGASTTFTFTVTRGGNTDGTSTANYAVTGSGTNAANASDFGGTLPSGTVTFAAGETSQEITITVSGDTDVESDDQFTVTLSNPSADAMITTDSADGTITNDDSSGGGGGGGGIGTDPNTRIFIPITVERAHLVPSDDRPSAIIFRAITNTIVSIVPIGLADAGELIRIVNDDLGPVGGYEGGVIRASLTAGELYAVLFASQAEDRIYSIHSSAGGSALSNAPGTNILIPTDVDISGETTPLDALIVINAIRRFGNKVSGESAEERASTFLDVNRDGGVSPLDALAIINYIRRRGRSAGESVDAPVIQAAAKATQVPISGASATSIDTVFASEDVGNTLDLTATAVQTVKPASNAALIDAVIEDDEDSNPSDSLTFVSEDLGLLSGAKG